MYARFCAFKSETCAGRYRRRTSMRRIFFVHAVKRQLHFLSPMESPFFRANSSKQDIPPHRFRGLPRKTSPHAHRAVVQQRRICNRQNGRGRVPWKAPLKAPANIARARSRKSLPSLRQMSVSAYRFQSKFPPASHCVERSAAISAYSMELFRVFVVIDNHICIRHICFPCLQWRGIFPSSGRKRKFRIRCSDFPLPGTKNRCTYTLWGDRHRRFGRREFDHRVKNSAVPPSRTASPCKSAKVIRAFFRRFQIIRAVKIQNISRDHRIIYGFGFAIIRPIGGIPPCASACGLVCSTVPCVGIAFPQHPFAPASVPQICPQHQKAPWRRSSGGRTSKFSSACEGVVLSFSIYHPYLHFIFDSCSNNSKPVLIFHLNYETLCFGHRHMKNQHHIDLYNQQKFI